MAAILLVEDDPTIASLLMELLVDQNHIVYLAFDGAEALARFHEKKPDLLITDIDLPIKNGLELILEIRQTDNNTDIMAISGEGMGGRAEYLKVADLLGANCILRKPFTPAQFSARVKSILEGETA